VFDNYVEAKNVKTSRWTVEFVVLAVVLHLVAGTALMV